MLLRNAALLFILICRVQAPCFAQSLLRFNFTHYNTEKGLASDRAKSLAVGARGHLWVASNLGLSRFDGVRFSNVAVKDERLGKLANNEVWQVVSDAQRRIWVVMRQGGVGLLNEVSGSVQWARLPKDAQASPWLVMQPGSNRLILMQGAQAPLVYSPAQHAFDKEGGWPTQLLGQPLESASPSPWPHQYFVFNKKGIGFFHTATRRLLLPGEAVAELPGWAAWRRLPPLLQMMVDSEGVCWMIGRKDGLDRLFGWNLAQGRWRLPGQSFETSNETDNYELMGLQHLGPQGRWVFGRYALARYQPTDSSFVSVEINGPTLHPLTARTITDVQTDEEGNVWIATANNGIFRCSPKSDHFRSLKHQNRHTQKEGLFGGHALRALPNGHLLAGYNNDGLAEFDAQGNHLNRHLGLSKRLKNYSVLAIEPSAQKDWWWLALSDRLIYYHLPTEKAIDHLSPWPADQPPSHLVEDQLGQLWIGRRIGGLFRWKKARQQAKRPGSFVADTVLAEGPVLQLLVKDQGQLWVVGKMGLVEVEMATGKVRSLLGKQYPQVPEWNGFLRYLLPLPEAQWLVATEKHLYRFDPQKQRLQQLPIYAFANTDISSLEQGGDGFVWASTYHGLHRVNLKTGTVVQFTKLDGLENDFFMRGSSARLADGRLAFGAPGNVAVFAPTEVSRDLPPAHTVQVHKLLVQHQALNADSVFANHQLTLTAQQHMVELDLGVNSLRDQPVLRYRLLGLDSSWRSVRSDYKLTFPYLPAGKYRLEMFALNAENLAGPISHLDIEVNSPFYLSWWFGCVVVLALAALLFLLDKQRMRRRSREQAMRLNLAKNLHQQVRLSLNSIEVLSQLARIKAKKDLEATAQLLGQIEQRSQQANLAVADMLWLVDPTNDGAAALLQRMQSLAMQMPGPVQRLLQCNWQAPWPAQLNMQARHRLLRAFQLVLALVAHLPLEACHLHLGRRKQALTMEWALFWAPEAGNKPLKLALPGLQENLLALQAQLLCYQEDQFSQLVVLVAMNENNASAAPAFDQEVAAPPLATDSVKNATHSSAPATGRFGKPV